MSTTKRFVSLNNETEEIVIVALTATTGYVTWVGGLMGFYGPGYTYATAEDIIEAYKRL